MKVSEGIHGRGRSGEEQINKGPRKWGNEDNEDGNEEAVVACEAGRDKEETGKQRDNEEKKEEEREDKTQWQRWKAEGQSQRGSTVFLSLKP